MDHIDRTLKKIDLICKKLGPPLPPPAVGRIVNLSSGSTLTVNPNAHSHSIAIGSNAVASNANSIAIGPNTTATTGQIYYNTTANQFHVQGWAPVQGQP